jgi:Protein of unknown function (DUF5131)
MRTGQVRGTEAVENAAGIPWNSRIRFWRMAKDSKIEWTHHTFNPWWGCTKVSPACDNCYAELWAKRLGQQIWGPAAHKH